MAKDRSLQQLSSDRLHPKADGNICRDPQILDRAQSFVEELGVELRQSDGTRIPQEDVQSQLTWVDTWDSLTETEPPTQNHA